MKSNPYNNVMSQSQALGIPQTQQQQGQPVNIQIQGYNAQQYIVHQQEQAIQNNPYNQYNPQTVVAFDISSSNQQISMPINPTQGTTNRNSWMVKIVIIYILQYSFQLGYVAVYLVNKPFMTIYLDENNQITPLFWCVLLMSIIIPIIGFNTKALQNNLSSLVLAILYLFVYTNLQVGISAISKKQQYSDHGDPITYGNYYTMGIIVMSSILFNIQGLLQLICLAIMLKLEGDKLTLKQFQRIGVVSSIVVGLWCIKIHILMLPFLAFIGIIFTFWFSYGLTRVQEEKFGLKQDQAVFGSFSVFIVMVCPCVTSL